MEKLLACFEYIKRYHVDMLDSISIMLELFILKNHAPEILEDFIAQGQKRKNIFAQLDLELKKLIDAEQFIAINPNINFLKIFKMLQSASTQLNDIEEFLHIVTQKKTANKLYYYSTPLEVNELLVRLLDIKDGESIYNPCYGIGSLFLIISQVTQEKHAQVSLYGEELDPRLAKVAKLICILSNLSFENLMVNDILKAPCFDSRFDKIMCNPPNVSHIGVEYLKDDKRFRELHGLAKTYSEWVFLIHALYHLKKRGVFVLRTQTLQKSSIESEFMQRFYKQGLIEAIIELPKNIFPHQNADFCVLVLSPNNKEILSIDAKNERFWKKDGKYNRLINLDSLLECFFARKNNDFCFLTPYSELPKYNLPIVKKKEQDSQTKSLLLGDLVTIFRGQRVYGGKNNTKITYYDVGLADFSDYGISKSFSTLRTLGDKAKIKKYALKAYDICLSLRGSTPKVGIFGENLNSTLAVANTGIVIVRARSKIEALGLYCYFYSHSGQKALGELYAHYIKTIDVENLKELRIPLDFKKNAEEKFQRLCDLNEKLESIKSELESLRE